jgi:hypothetical protein
MADVHVHVTNKTGGKVSLTLDEDDARIEYFKTLVKRDELEAVTVSKPTAPKK